MISSRKRFKRDIEEVSDQESIETYKKLANEIDICTFTYKKIQKPKNKNSIQFLNYAHKRYKYNMGVILE